MKLQKRQAQNYENLDKIVPYWRYLVLFAQPKCMSVLSPPNAKNIHAFVSVYDKNDSQSVRCRIRDKIGFCEWYLHTDFAGETDSTLFLLSGESRFISEDE